MRKPNTIGLGEYTDEDLFAELAERAKGWDIKKDHEAIKQQMKGWEQTLDKIVGWIYDAHQNDDTIDTMEIAVELESISNEMMSINI